MEELLKALGPWPTVQGIAIGIVVAGVGIWAMRRGMLGKDSNAPPIEEVKARWETHSRIEHIHDNSFEIVKLLERLVDIADRQLAALNRIADTRWNKHQ